MTIPERDPNEPRDPALDAAWRTASDEAPPPALDAAILAAAHRAVGSKPQGSAAHAPWRWWSPLVAAAAIGAVAIGVLQLTPDEHDASTTTVSDTPRAEQRAAATADAPALRPPAETAKSAAAAASASNAPTVAEAKQRTAPTAPPASNAPTATSGAATVAGKLEQQTLRPTEASRDQQAAASARDADPFPAAKRDLPAAPPPAAAAVPAERQKVVDAKATAEPTAGTTAERARETPASRADAAAASTSMAAPVAAPAISPPVRAKEVPGVGTTSTSRDEPAQQQPADARRDNLAAMRAAPMSAPAPVAGGRIKDEAEHKLAQRPAPATAESAALAKVQADKRRAPDDFVATIRRLLAAGENEAAKRELAAFREAHADADSRLPVELRAWAASIPR